MGALDGLVVLDLATFIAAPMCATLLGEFGAEVIKVEQPGVGDDPDPRAPGRRRVPLVALRRPQQESITCNLRDPGGRAGSPAVPGVDVVAENFRPGTLERWGLGVEALRAENSRARDGPDLGLRPDGAVPRAAGVRAHRGGGRVASHICRVPGPPP